MEDYMIRATGAGGQIRAFAAVTGGLVEEARKRHEASPVVTAALGRLLTAGVMMGSMMKNDSDLLTLLMKGDGPIGGLTVTADSRGHVKGYADDPWTLLPAKNGKLDVGGAIGEGVLRVIKDMGLKEPYVGETMLVTGEVAEDLTYYFAHSEQVPSSVGLGVLMSRDNAVRRAGGFIVQLMPFADEKTIEALEMRLSEITSVTEILEEDNRPESLLEWILGDLGFEVTETGFVAFACDCSREKVSKALLSLGKKDRKELAEGGESLEVKCHFCNSSYVFSPEDILGATSHNHE